VREIKTDEVASFKEEIGDFMNALYPFLYVLRKFRNFNNPEISPVSDVLFSGRLSAY